MSAALSPEARERLRLIAGSLFTDGERAGLQFPITFGDLRALLADSDALAAAERERDEARATNQTLNRIAQHWERAAIRAKKIEQRIADHERGKPLGRIEASFALAAAQTDADALRAQVAKLREALECAQYELRLWVQTYGERGPTRFVMGSIDEALTSTAAVATPVPETEGGGR